MNRFCVLAVLALLPANAAVAQTTEGKKFKNIRIEDKLTQDDAKDRVRNAPAKVHTVQLKGGNTYTIDMVSNEFDSYLRLEDSRGRQLAEDDDSGGNLNARIIFNCPKTGQYKVICTSFNPNGAGRFVLTVKGKLGIDRPLSAHALLLGKAAPDFKSDFALNGKAAGLQDLKGKVVLLAFWEVRSETSAGTLTKLRDWSKAHKGEGLEVVGVTFYPSEIGQPIAFDKETGKIKDLPRSTKVTRESEQATLREFAGHHNLEHLLLTLSREEALKTFNAYAVNGIPQLVLIDRHGVVRMIRMGDGEGNLPAVEGEMKKLLTEKQDSPLPSDSK
jgi:peroxiredoxin